MSEVVAESSRLHERSAGVYGWVEVNVMENKGGRGRYKAMAALRASEHCKLPAEDKVFRYRLRRQRFSSQVRSHAPPSTHMQPSGHSIWLNFVKSRVRAMLVVSESAMIPNILSFATSAAWGDGRSFSGSSSPLCETNTEKVIEGAYQVIERILPRTHPQSLERPFFAKWS